MINSLKVLAFTAFVFSIALSSPSFAGHGDGDDSALADY